MSADPQAMSAGDRGGTAGARVRRTAGNRRAALLALPILIAGLAGQALAQDAAPADKGIDYSVFVPRLIERFAVPAAEDLGTRLVTLETAINAACAADLDAAAAKRARADFAAAFRAAVVAHGHLSTLRIGALADENRAERLAFIPDSRGVVRRQVTRLVAAGDPSALQASSLRDKSVALQGLTALEWIAYDKDGAVTLGSAGKPERRDYVCGYARALGERLIETAGEVSKSYRDPDGQTALLLTPGPDNSLAKTDKEASGFVFNALLTALELSRDQVVAPLLAEGPAAARAARVPFARSHTAFDHLAATLDGFAGAINAAGFADADSDAQWIGNTVSFEARNAGQALGAISPDPLAALEDEKDLGKLAYVRTVLDGLRPMIAGELAGYLDFKGGFNALDGD